MCGIGLTCVVVHMGVPRISYLRPVWWYTWESLGYPTYVLHRTVEQDRHIGLICVVVHMGVPRISYLRPT